MDNQTLNYPSELPVCEHRDEIIAAMRQNPVVIVCGDTGSGKTTQLPKMAWEAEIANRRKEGSKPRRRRIAITQPRRLAAVTMAERVAEELKSEIGGLVGYRHRFGRKVSPQTHIEFMTDGVLLAETRRDPLLLSYDTVIVDEAHERSLNIDFLLGILKRILAKRNNLKVIVSSATLDADRFSSFFDGAPVINVPGRLFPIEIGYRPTPDHEERDLPREVASAVAELPVHDDILVFLPGERDIRETADFLSNAYGESNDIIPLLASLPAAEQRRAFLPSSRRRIILATNVAETSVTIPGIRAVIDSGLARISRYVHRTQVQLLQIEPVSQASARQRAGRCGRLGPGICLRLYSEEDLNARDPFTPPEVLRTSLAGVILTMLKMKLGNIERFPFIDPPRPAMVREGLRELLELGAIERSASTLNSEGKGEIVLTEIGQKLAEIPVEPRLARMLIAASESAVLPSVLPLVSAMACDDPRRRPIDEREKADQAHALFKAPGSDFLGTLKMWRWWEDMTKDLSQTKTRKLCKATYLSYPKMREWQDLTRQLETLCKRIGLSFAEFKSIAKKSEARENDFSAALHRALLSGLLGRIGKYDDEERNYKGAHGLRFTIHPSSVLAKAAKKNLRQKSPGKERPHHHAVKPPSALPSWIMAGELVDTSSLFARNTAAIDVRWLESVAGHLCKHCYHSPEWDAKFGFVRATEQVTLYGLVIVPSRRCDLSRINPAVAREVFIRRGLIDGEFPSPPPEVRANLQLLDALRKHAERSRLSDVFCTERLFAHFDRILPADICSANALRKWLRRPDLTTAERTDRTAFRLKKSDWWPKGTTADRDFPDSLRIAGKPLWLDYRHVPDDPENDGVTCSVRQADTEVLRLWRDDWLVPGLLPEKISWMLATLPSSLRRLLAPLNDAATILLSMLKPGAEPLDDAVCRAVNERWGFRIPSGVWDWNKLPTHLKMRFRVRDDQTGRTILCSRNKDEILAASHVENQPSTEPSAPHQTKWVFGTIPAEKTDKNSGWATVSYPALQDEGDGVTLKLHTNQQVAAESHAAGVTRLFVLALAKSFTMSLRRKNIGFEAALYLKDIDYDDKRISADLLTGSIREALVRNRPAVLTEDEFARRLDEAPSSIMKLQGEMFQILIDSAAAATRIYSLMEGASLPEETHDSVSTQISWLLFPGFLCTVPMATLRHYRRYLKGAQIRLERARLSPSSDLRKEALFAPYWSRYRELVSNQELKSKNASALADIRWMLEEYRVSLFAQELHTPEPISPKRLDAAMSGLCP